MPPSDVRKAVLRERRLVRRALAAEAERNEEWASMRSVFADDTARRVYTSRAIGVREAITRLNEAWREADRAERRRATLVHRCPPRGSGVMPCCGATPFEASSDRMTKDQRLVTCKRRTRNARK